MAIGNVVALALVVVFENEVNDVVVPREDEGDV